MILIEKLKNRHISVQKYQRFVVMDLRSSDLLVLHVYLDIIKIRHIIAPIYHTEVINSEKNLYNTVGKTYLDKDTL